MDPGPGVGTSAIWWPSPSCSGQLRRPMTGSAQQQVDLRRTGTRTGAGTSADARAGASASTDAGAKRGGRAGARNRGGTKTESRTGDGRGGRTEGGGAGYSSGDVGIGAGDGEGDAAGEHGGRVLGDQGAPGRGAGIRQVDGAHPAERRARVGDRVDPATGTEGEHRLSAVGAPVVEKTRPQDVLLPGGHLGQPQLLPLCAPGAQLSISHRPSGLILTDSCGEQVSKTTASRSGS